MAIPHLHLTAGAAADRVYRTFFRQISADALATQSIGIPLQHGVDKAMVHAYAVWNRNKPPTHLVLAAPGATHSVFTSVDWIEKLISKQMAVIVHETFGHGAVSSDYTFKNPMLRSAAAMEDGWCAMLDGGLLPLFTANPHLKDLPVTAMGHSMGGGTLAATLFLQGGLALKTSTDTQTLISRAALIAPRLRLNDENPVYSAPIRHGLAPLVHGLLTLSGGRLERVLHPMTRFPDASARRLQLNGIVHQIPPRAIPLSYATTVFAHDEKRLQQFYTLSVFEQRLPTLWGVFNHDREVNAPVIRRVANHLFNDHPTLFELNAHNPLGDNALIDALVDFLKAETRN